MELLTAIMELSWAQLFVAGAAVMVFFGMVSGSSDDTDIDIDEEYANASWNPASVNYNG